MKQTRRWLSVFSIVYLCTNVAQAFSAYTNDELDQLEQSFIQEINSSTAVVRNPLAKDYINHLAKVLAEHGELNQPYFFIVKSNEINAFAGPGGYIGVNTQLILASDTESELAAVMAHEMSHVRQHHLYRMLEHQKQMRVPMLASILAAAALGAINPALSTGALMGSLSGFAQDNINFVRANEKEADSIGIDMLTKAGFDPVGMAGFFKKMQETGRYRYSNNVPAILRTHPLDEDRIAEAEGRAGTRKTHATIPSSKDYQLFKELIRNTVKSNPKQLEDDYHYRCKQQPSDSACHYGLALMSLQNDQYREAIAELKPLIAADANNLYYNIALAKVYKEQAQSAQAVSILNNLYTNFPDSYAVLSEYSDALISDHQADKAVRLLLIGTRQFKNDLPLCQSLARAEASAHHMGYAYFSMAECHLLQGERHDALRQLKLAQSFAKNDRILQARIAAKIELITRQSN